MAMVHPSRMGLVPQESSNTRGRTSSPPPRLSGTRSRPRSGDSSSRRGKDEFGRDRERGGERDSDRDERRSGYGDRSRRRDQERARADDYFNDNDRDDGSEKRRKRSRSRSVDHERDREREERRERERDGGRGRRGSPEYGEYRRSSPGRGREGERDAGENGASKAAWRQPDNMYPNRDARHPHGGGYSGGGADFMESRRQQREVSTIILWPPSPKEPTRIDSPTRDYKRHKKTKSRKRPRDESASDTDSGDSEEERRRRERKERKKTRKEKKERERERDKNKDRDREHRRHRSRSRRYDDEDSDRDRDRSRERRKRHQSRSKSHRSSSRRSATRTKSPEQRPPSTPGEDEWVEKPVAGMVTSFSQSGQGGASSASMPPPLLASSSTDFKGKAPAEDDEFDDEVGPQLFNAKSLSRNKVDERQYGGALLRGEGSAMAAFLKDGTDVRIPRRGEIGLSSGEIATFESVGYVMSGSRHRRMNAVRMRKENQVISAEEKRGILKLQQEERERREAILREEFQQLVQEKLKSQGAAK